MANKLLLVNFIIVLVYGVVNCADAEFKVCAIQDLVAKSQCDILESEGVATCVPVVDSVDCALKIKNGKANVGSFNAEQALVVGKYLDSTVSVVGSTRHKDKKYDEFAFESVVVVKSNFPEGDLKNLAGKQFCHPGFKFEDTWSKRVLTEFEEEVVPLKCGSSDSYAVEDEFKSLATYFGKSCRPGKWAPNDDKVDKELKQKYKSLCELCDNQEACEYMSGDKNPHKHALRCLTQLNGEVAYVGLSFVKDYFGLESTSKVQEANPNDYRFLCPNGSLQSISTGKPCTWVKQPWPVIVTTKSIQDSFKHNIFETGSSAWQETLKSIITPSDYILLENSTELVPYITQGRKIPTQDSEDKCRRNMKWCTVSQTEQEKCDWLSQAVLIAGIRPGLSCVRGSDTLDCMKKIQSRKADIISIDSNYGYLARKKYDLGPIFYHEAKGEKSLVVAVIKNEDAARFTKFDDLKGKNVCLPEYGGIAYISTTVFGKNFTNSTIEDKCDYGAAMSAYFNAGCVPGARDDNHGVTKGTDKEKLCSLCQITELAKSSTTCAADLSNKFFGDLGALQCLRQGQGDIAFVERLAASKIEDATNYRIICKNNRLSAISGFDVGEECALSATVGGETMTRSSDADRAAYELFLADLESAFRDLNIIKHSTFNMFADFNDQPDVLFKSNIIGFDHTDDPNNKYVKNYKQLFSEVDGCTIKSGATQLIASLLLPVLLLALLF